MLQQPKVPLVFKCHEQHRSLASLYIIHYTLYIIHYTLYVTNYTLYIIHYTLYIIHYTLYTIHYTDWTSGRKILARLSYTCFSPTGPNTCQVDLCHGDSWVIDANSPDVHVFNQISYS